MPSRRAFLAYLGSLAAALYPLEELAVAAPVDVSLWISDPDGMNLSGVVEIRATATPQQNLTAVEIYVDDALVASGPSSPLSYQWDTAQVADGTHRIRGEAAYKKRRSKTQIAVTTANTVPPPPPPPPPDVTWEGPITVSSGQTISGRNFQGSNTVVSIRTTQPVVIENCRIKATADFYKMIDFYEVGSGVDLTIRNCHIYGTDSWTSPRWLVGNKWKNLVVENCTIDNTRGIELWASGTVPQVTRIRFNRHNNIKSDGSLANVGNFIQTRVIGQSTQIEIAWNEILNEYGKCWGEDMMSLYHTSNVWVHDNLIKHVSNPNNAVSSQGGITFDASDRSGDPVANCIAEGNYLIDALAISVTAQYAGNDNNIIRNNRMVGAGKLPNGSNKNIGNPPTAFNFYRGSNRGDQCYGNYGNFVGQGVWIMDHAGVKSPDSEDWPNWAVWGCRGCGDNTYAAAVAEAAKNTWGSTRPTAADEAAEYDSWKSKVASAGVTIGASF